MISITKADKKELLTLAENENDITGIYARMMLSFLAGRGVRLSHDELDLIFSGDNAVLQALDAALDEFYDNE